MANAYEDMGILKKIGLAIGENVNPGSIDRYVENYRNQQALSNLADLAPNIDMANGGIMGNLNKIAAADPTLLQDYVKGQIGSATPSSIREYQYFSHLPKEQQEAYLRVKRAQQVIDYGSGIGTVDATGGLKPLVNKDLPPEQLPATKQAQAAATEVGKELGINQAELNNMQAMQPQLENTAQRLGDLAELASYTDIGQAKDEGLRQLGMKVGIGANARASYISLVDNTVLPLLRQTFGAQFTKEEGDSLKATLGNVNLSPSEKKAALMEFINSKRDTIQSKMRAVGKNPQDYNPAPFTFNGDKSKTQMGDKGLSSLSIEQLKALRQQKAGGQ